MMTVVLTLTPSAVPSVAVPDIKLGKPSFLVYVLEDGTHYFCHSNEPKAFIYKTFSCCASAYLKANRPCSILHGSNAAMVDILSEYEDYFHAHFTVGVDKIVFCPKTKAMEAVHDQLVENVLSQRAKDKKAKDTQSHIDAEVARQLEQVMVQQGINVRPTDALMTAKVLAGMVNGLTPNRLNQLVYEAGLQEPYRVNDTQYWKLTSKGMASEWIDNVPIGNASISTTRFTQGILNLPSIMDLI